MLRSRFDVQSEKNAFVLKLIKNGRTSEIERFLSEVNDVNVPWQKRNDHRYKEILQEEIIKKWKSGKEDVTERDRPDW